MRRLLGFIVVVVILVGCGVAAIIVTKPAFAEAWFPGVFAEHHRELVRERFTLLAGHIVRGEGEQCTQFAEPEYVRLKGTEITKLVFAPYLFWAKVGRLTEADVRIDKINLGPDRRTAEVEYSLHYGNAWHAQKQPMKWVRAGGQWYLESAPLLTGQDGTSLMPGGGW